MKQNSEMCCMGACPRCHAGIKLLVGILVLANAYWPFASWGILIGWILTIGGLLKLTMPSCPHCR